MRYISDDGKVFNTEQECCEYENLQKKRLEEERLKKERLEMERKDKLNVISKKYEELKKLVSEYGRDYGINQEIYFKPFYDFVSDIFGI